LTTPELGVICAKGIAKTSVVTGEPEIHFVAVYGAEVVDLEAGFDVWRDLELELEYEERGGIGAEDAG
jgi:hypothetical protein